MYELSCPYCGLRGFLEYFEPLDILKCLNCSSDVFDSSLVDRHKILVPPKDDKIEVTGERDRAILE